MLLIELIDSVCTALSQLIYSALCIARNNVHIWFSFQSSCFSRVNEKERNHIANEGLIIVQFPQINVNCPILTALQCTSVPKGKKLHTSRSQSRCERGKMSPLPQLRGSTHSGSSHKTQKTSKQQKSTKHCQLPSKKQKEKRLGEGSFAALIV